MMRRAFGLMLAFSFLVGCDSNAPTKPTTSKPSGSPGGVTGAGSGSTDKTLRIAVIPKGTTHVFWKSVHAGAEKAAKELGNVEILWKGPLLENDDWDARFDRFMDRADQGLFVERRDADAIDLLRHEVLHDADLAIAVVLQERPLPENLDVAEFLRCLLGTRVNRLPKDVRRSFGDDGDAKCLLGRTAPRTGHTAG